MKPDRFLELLDIIQDGVKNKYINANDAAVDMNYMVEFIKSEDNITNRLAAFEWIKNTKRKIFNTKGERKILEKIDHLKQLRKEVSPLIKSIRKGEDFDEISSNDDWVEIIFNASDSLESGSKALSELSRSKKLYEVIATLGFMDEYYSDEGEDDEESDRQALVQAISQFYTDSDNKIKQLQKRLERQKLEQKKGGKIREKAHGERKIIDKGVAEESHDT